MGIILVAGIVAFYFFNKKKMTFGEWVRQLHILLKLGIFTGIIGFILNVISSWFFANELTPFILHYNDLCWRNINIFICVLFCTVYCDIFKRFIIW